MKTIAVHQPNFLPWLGYFFKINSVDVFVLQDDVDFESGNAESVTNRTRIKGPEGEVRITVPVRHRTGEKQINRILIDTTQKWIPKQLNVIRNAYGKSPWFDVYFPGLCEVLNKKHTLLAELNIDLIRLCCNWLEIDTPMQRASALNITGLQKSALLAAICNRLEADVYLSGNGARKYNDPLLFEKHRIQLAYSSFKPSAYPQMYAGFIPGLSILDALFTVGPDTKNIISNENSTHTGI